MNAPTAPQSVGEGRYRIDQLVGQGPASTVFAAHDVRLRRDVAVRVFHRPVEAEVLAAAAQVWTGGISRILDAGSEVDSDGVRRDFVVREVVRGLSLGRLTSVIECRPTTIAAMGASVAATLTALHGRGVAHGSLHAGNIFLRDFAASPDWGRDAAESTVLTDFGVGSRCPRHPAPADDLWALGASLLGVLTGRPVTGYRTARSALGRLPQQHGRGFSGLGADERAAWVELLTALVDPEPGGRPDALEALVALKKRQTG